MTAKQKPNVAVRLPDDLQTFLAAAAAKSYRSLSAEIRMRLEQSRLQDESRTQQIQKGQP
jgi:plasmid stability protein